MTTGSGRPPKTRDDVIAYVLVLSAAIASTALIAVDVSLSATDTWSHSPLHTLAVATCIVLACAAIIAVAANRVIRAVRALILEAEQRAVIRLDSLRHGQVEQLARQSDDTGEIRRQIEQTNIGEALEGYARGYAAALAGQGRPLPDNVRAFELGRRIGREQRD